MTSSLPKPGQAFAKQYCCCWVWSTQRCPAHTQCLSWWAGSGPPRRSASGRLHIWNTPGGKLCPERASSSQTLWSSSRRKHRDRPDQRAWGRHQHEHWEEENLHRTNPDVMAHTPTWGSLSDTVFFPACSKAGVPPPRVDSRTGRSSGSPRASTAQWPSGRTCRRCSAGSRRMWAEMEASAGPRPPAPYTGKWLETQTRAEILTGLMWKNDDKISIRSDQTFVFPPRCRTGGEFVGRSKMHILIKMKIFWLLLWGCLHIWIHLCLFKCW